MCHIARRSCLCRQAGSRWDLGQNAIFGTVLTGLMVKTVKTVQEKHVISLPTTKVAG